MHIVVRVFGVAAFLTSITPAGAQEANSLSVRLQPDRYIPGLSILNIGKGTITIVGVSINERPDCKFTFNRPVEPPRVLQVGDYAEGFTSCQIVRARIVTDKGIFEYSFTP